MMKEFFIDLPGAKVNYEGQGMAYIAVPEGTGGGKRPAIVAVHGSGRSAADYFSTPFYIRQRDIVLEQGCIFAAISNCADVWGTDDGFYNLYLLMEYIAQNHNAKPRVGLWATSAGGILANRMVAKHPEKVAFVIGIFPVFDLLSVFSLASCRRAWKTEDLEQFKKKVGSINPAGYPQKLVGHKYYIAHGSADVAVPLETNSKKLQILAGENVYLEIIENGIHGTADFSYYGKAVKIAFSENIDYFETEQ